jgi:RND family efflux transporter MFP subunit
MKPRLQLPALMLVALLGASLAGCGEKTPEQAAAAKTVRAEVGTVELTRQPAYDATPASLVAETQVTMASRLMGFIRAIDVAEGQSVAVGQRLFSIDPVELQGQAAQARAALRQAEDARTDARLEYERFAALLKEEVVTRQQYEKMKLQLDIAESRVAQANAALSSAGNQLRYATVTSPIAGVVTRKLAQAGDLAAPGQPVLVLENPHKLQVETHVPEHILATLKPGAPVPVEVDGQDAAIEARVARISPAADPVSRTFLVKLDIAAPGLRSGQFARALFPIGEREVLTVPQSALVNRAGIEGVFVVGADSSAQFRMVRSGQRQDGRVEVQAGLREGERVVVGGDIARLESGDKIGA